MNPISTNKGTSELNELKGAVRGCELRRSALDWLMDFPLIRCSTEERAQRERSASSTDPLGQRALALRAIVLPFVDNSSMRTEEEKGLVLRIS